MRATAEEEVSSKLIGVADWRKQQLARAGYDSYTAALLGPCLYVDLHDAIDLLRAGCSQSLALKILL